MNVCHCHRCLARRGYSRPIASKAFPLWAEVTFIHVPSAFVLATVILAAVLS